MPDARSDGDEGVTLVELLVTMFILGIVTAAAYSVLISVTRQSRDVQGREQTVGNARLAIEQIDRQIRSGNVLYDPALEALPNSMRVYTQANGVNRCVQWQLQSAGVLRSRSWSPTWQTDGLVYRRGAMSRGESETPHRLSACPTPVPTARGSSTSPSRSMTTRPEGPTR